MKCSLDSIIKDKCRRHRRRMIKRTRGDVTVPKTIVSFYIDLKPHSPSKTTVAGLQWFTLKLSPPLAVSDSKVKSLKLAPGRFSYQN